ncbi:MAG: UDP-glucose 4-epimerase GalE [Candidatus Omnitrophota bacterium]
MGSVMVRRLLERGHRVCVFDNLSTGFRGFVPQKAVFFRGDLRHEPHVREFFKRYRVDAVMHFAASCLVGESVANPLKYYENNVSGSANLLHHMCRAKVKNLIISSTCATYGQPRQVPIVETAPTCPANPYGISKLMVERMVETLALTGQVRYVSLRYFNAAGSDGLGGIGEKHDPETHLIPNIFKAINGLSRRLEIFGDDYPTPDGTCVRDYIHVEDLARAHLLALEALTGGKVRNEVFNLGSEKGFSVLEIVRKAQEITGREVPCKICPRRPGDPARLIACAAKAKRVLGWRSLCGLDRILTTAWAWENFLARHRLD